MRLLCHALLLIAIIINVAFAVNALDKTEPSGLTSSELDQITNLLALDEDGDAHERFQSNGAKTDDAVADEDRAFKVPKLLKEYIGKLRAGPPIDMDTMKAKVAKVVEIYKTLRGAKT
ncbi:hypothetical protein PHYBOEH_007693 [Phytophthora boehmeriae]|uniref:RxLR effector protein n=1 Tax=Phytophthora boehmeriae TaxID=109152 RepID=A0A8T1W4F4_9STRA|nr:hypothetical protein PHYBOEH_007693 [Phytophthora boehmeriae]